MKYKPIEIEKNINLKNKNTMAIEAVAKEFLSIKSKNQLSDFCMNKKENSKIYVLGGGSNTLFLGDFDGIILSMEILGKKIIKENDQYIWVEVNAGEDWHEFVLWALKNDYGGIENLSLIPGKVGTSPMQNIGAYGVEVKDIFHELKAIEIKSGKERVFSHLECEFDYRESIFKNELKNQYIISSVCFKLSKPPHKLKVEYGAIKQELQKMKVEKPSIQDVSKAVISIRESKLPNPKQIPNCGSFFKNPIIDKEVFSSLLKKHNDMPSYKLPGDRFKVPAAWLIEKSGWKGFKNEKVGVHDKQALVLINHNKGSGKDIFELSERILKDVEKKFGIKLIREVNVI